MTDRPKQQTAADFQPEVLRLFDQYVHGQLDRRGFLDRAARYAAGGAAGAAGLLAALSPNFAQAQQVAPDDARIKTEFVEFPSPGGYEKVRAYVARPANSKGPLPVVLVAHENRGLNPHIEDITRRLAVADFIAVAPDALFPLGGYPGDEDKARELFGKLDQAKTREDFIASAHYARSIAGSNGQLGAVGFCYGGGIVNMLATQVKELRTGAAFYGSPPPLDQVMNIGSNTELLMIFAAEDDRINSSWPAYKDTLEVAGVKFEAEKYPGTQHGFNNDTTPRYDKAAAGQAWGRTMALFNRVLRA
ncbi:MAG: dienelactone hydrolase family protein [Burkholderiales bacterium]